MYKDVTLEVEGEMSAAQPVSESGDCWVTQKLWNDGATRVSVARARNFAMDHCENLSRLHEQQVKEIETGNGFGDRQFPDSDMCLHNGGGVSCNSPNVGLSW